MRLFRIIGYSLLSLLLLGILVVGIGAKTFSFQEMTDSQTDTSTISHEHVARISIDWSAGNVTIRSANVSHIVLTETRSGNSKPLVWRMEGDQLEVDFQPKRPGIGFLHTGKKDLLVEIPQDWVCHELELDVTDGSVLADELDVKLLELDGTSGDYTFTNCTAERMEGDVTSGDVTFSGNFEIVEFETTSGNLKMTLNNCPQRLDLEATSGDLDITLPDTCGFQAHVNVTSGHFRSDFETISHGNVYTAGDGACRIKAEATSGNITIHKGQPATNRDH